MIDLKNIYDELVNDFRKMTKEDFIKDFEDVGCIFVDLETAVYNSFAFKNFKIENSSFDDYASDLEAFAA